MHVPLGSPSIVFASASLHDEQFVNPPPVAEQISQVGHFFYRIIHFIYYITDTPFRNSIQIVPVKSLKGHAQQQSSSQPGPLKVAQFPAAQLSLSES